MQRGIFYFETDRQSDRDLMYHDWMYDRIVAVSVMAGGPCNK